MKTTPLHRDHIDRHAKMGAFAEYDMPLYYGEGTLAEHLWTRESAGLFDVSHMGQFIAEGPGTLDFLARVTPSDFSALPDGQARYTVLTNEQGGIVDDLIVTRLSADKAFIVVNAGTKDKDFAWLQAHLPDEVTLRNLEDRALIALQGPLAEQALRAALHIDMSALSYMTFMTVHAAWGELWISRLGYTGEDGFELSLPGKAAIFIWQELCAHPAVKPVGLVARDSLRLEMGYPLYGHDIDDRTTPVEAGLSWVIAKGNHGFIGADAILEQRRNGPAQKRIGLRLTAPGIAREGADILAADGQKIGILTSGGFSPSLKQSIGMGYIPVDQARVGAILGVSVRGRVIPADMTTLPFLTTKTRHAAK